MHPSAKCRGAFESSNVLANVLLARRRQLALVCSNRSSGRQASPKTTPVPGFPEATQEELESPLSKLVGVFLNRASSSLKRGTATCLTCKGQGSCTCSQCQGTGLVSKEASRMNVVKHAAQRAQQLLHLEGASHDTDWLMTNRCRRCRGSGLVMCATCGGLGVRSPTIKPPAQGQQSAD